MDAVAKKLCSAVRQTDTVARMGGDEFVIVMPEFRDEKDAERCAEAILQKVRDRLGVARPKENEKKEAPEKKAADDAGK